MIINLRKIKRLKIILFKIKKKKYTDLTVQVSFISETDKDFLFGY
jgi:hypothetical protein